MTLLLVERGTHMSAAEEQEIQTKKTVPASS
jgi:hypothetical protein